MIRMLGALITLLAVTISVSAQASAFDSKASHAILMDEETGAVLYAKNSEEPMPPSSMSKLMTIYMVFDALKKGSISLDDTFLVSEKAWSKQGSKMFVGYNDRVPVEALIRGVIVQSGNDACIVLAEGLAGSEEAFAEAMNYKAQELGFKHSHFVNATGWPHDEHVMSPYDLAILAIRLKQDFPEYFKYFAEKEYTYNGIRQFNRNTLLHRDVGIDGLKTGHTEAAGYGIVITGEQDGRRLVVVVNGLDSQKERVAEAERIFHYGIRNFENVKLLKQGDIVEQAEVWFGDKHTVPLTVEKDVQAVLPKYWLDKGTEVKVKYNAPIPAPIKAGSHIADLVIADSDIETITVPLVAAEDVKELSALSHIMRAAEYYVLRGSY